MVSNLCSRPITRIARVLQVRTEMYWKGCVEKLSPPLSWTLNSLKILIIKNAGLSGNIHIFFMSLSSQIPCLMLHIVTQSVSLTTAFTCIATTWLACQPYTFDKLFFFFFFSRNKYINNTKICETGFVFFLNAVTRAVCFAVLAVLQMTVLLTKTCKRLWNDFQYFCY